VLLGFAIRPHWGHTARLVEPVAMSGTWQAGQTAFHDVPIDALARGRRGAARGTSAVSVAVAVERLSLSERSIVRTQRTVLRPGS
jgi:hypothetical protein